MHSINVSFLSLSLKKCKSEDGEDFFPLGQGLAKYSQRAKYLSGEVSVETQAGASVCFRIG